MSDEQTASQPKTIEERRRALDEKIERQREELETARAEQELVDLEARLELEAEHGRVAAVKVTFRQGFPTRAFVRTPLGPEYKRFKSQVTTGTQQKNQKLSIEASELLAKACWVYPTTQEGRDAMLNAFPGLLTSISIAASSLAQGNEEEEGKD